MRKLTEHDRTTALRYAAREPDYNLFILGDIENHGLEGEDVEAFAVDGTDDGEPYDALLLRYRNSYVACSHHGNYRADLLGSFLQGRHVDCLSGKAETVEKLLPWLPDKKVRREYLSILTEDHPPEFGLPSGLRERMLTPYDAAEIVGLYAGIAEFAENYAGKEEAQTENLRFSLGKGGRGIGAFDGDQLVSVACTSAENSISAMIVGVATREEYRRLGLASRLVASLCTQCLGAGMHTLCLFFDNPLAGAIYRKIGFRESGSYMLVM